ncbi:NADH:flavin oxidoreductase [uncultured Secundilactobacillus sp.]|uniref:oxidoreductase n=1 Tax=uncultured Secundilactobacillus sp. TaxID=2813935 RepID=UPI00258A2C82|nr:NADH:flavin oxidoreductase [uncultured Secundilactobacillus sp.]
MEQTTVFNPIDLGAGLTLKNRFVLTPLDMQLSRENGQVTQRDLAFHRSRSRDVGLDIIGSAYVDLAGNTALHSVAVDTDETIPGLIQLAQTIHQNQTKAVLQLVHAGRATNKGATQGQTIIGPSSIAAPFAGFPVPETLSDRAISKVMNHFIDAAHRAEKAGFDGVELHGANSFLLQQFVSPASNDRTDKYGGTLVRRLRFPVELVTRLTALIKSFHHDFALGYRLSPEELIADGMSLADTLALAKVLDDCGITYLSLSLRNYAQTSATMPTIQTEIVTLFKQVVHCPIMVAGGIKTSENVVDAGLRSALVGVGSALIKDPNWLKKVRNELNVD